MIDIDECFEYIGQCEDCGSELYFKPGLPLLSKNPAPGCNCWIDLERENKNAQ